MPTDVSQLHSWALAAGAVPLLIVLLEAFGVGWVLGLVTVLLVPALIVGVFWVGGGFYDGVEDRWHRAAAGAALLATIYVGRGIEAAGSAACEAGSLPGLAAVEFGYCWRQSLLLPVEVPSLGIATGGDLVSVPMLSFLIATVLCGLAGHMYGQWYADRAVL